MPSAVVERGGRFGARHRGVWLGTFDSAEEAREASRRASAAPERRRKRKVVAPTRGEAEALCDLLRGDLGDFARCAMWSGLRLFEVAALTADDVVVYPDGSVRLKVRHGKGDRPRVSVLLPEGHDAVLGREGLLFRRERGGAWTRKTVSRRWVVARRRLGLGEEVTFHTLRHLHATMLLDRGVSVLDVSLQLGHSDGGALVRSTYGHPDAGAALDRIAAI